MRNLYSTALGLVLAAASLGLSSEAGARINHRAVHAHNRSRHLAAVHRGHEGGGNTATRIQRGMASVYAEKFRGRRMADGTRFDPVSNAAASKTLPLGTTAHVTNLENGRTATVQVRDRGPHRPGRIIDVSPGSASSLGMDRHGTAPVAVAPVGREPS